MIKPVNTQQNSSFKNESEVISAPPMFTVTLSTMVKTETKCLLTDKWIKKMWSTHVHTHNGILLSPKENEILPFLTTWMDLHGVMLSEVSQRPIPYDLRWNPKGRKSNS